MNYPTMYQNGIFDSLPDLEAIQALLRAQNIDDLPQKYYPPEGESFSQSIVRLSDERVKLYLAAIDKQGKLELAGVARIDVIRSVFNFYANGILGGDISAAVNDLQQQETDLSIMSSFSHSFRVHAEAYGAKSYPQSYQSAANSVEAQFEVLRRFKLDRDAKDHAAIEGAKTPSSFTPQQACEYLEKFGISTLAVAQFNFELAHLNLELYINMVKSHTVWLRALQENTSPSLPVPAYTANDLEYDLELLSLALERCGAYAWRGSHLISLTEKCYDRYEDLWRGKNLSVKSVLEKFSALYLPPDHRL